jgi:hypothetical protein
MTPSLWAVPLQVIAVLAGRLDLLYLRTWATSLDVADLLDRALSPEHENSAT